jgi:sarcosine oxidase, subunit beta
MSGTETFDVVVIGGGIMGCTTALWLARGGMRCALVERGGLCMEASGRNAGTLTMMFTRAALIPYAMRGRELWQDAPNWLGRDVGFQSTPGLGLALNEADGERLRAETEERREAGAPIEIIGANRAREIEPAISDRPVLAAYCPIDGYAYSYRIGAAYRRALVADGVTLHEGHAVEGIEPDGQGFTIATGAGTVKARRIVLAGGVWLDKMAAWFGLDMPIICRVNQGTITERLPPILNTVIEVFGHLSLKQAINGTALIGTVLHWIDDAERAAEQIDQERLVKNMTKVVGTAASVIPALAVGRAVRTWTGLEAYAPDNQPVIGPVPGVPDAYIIGAMRSGFTAGPFMGKLLADTLLGSVPEMPIFDAAFDPARLLGMKGGEEALAKLAFA